MTLLESNDYFTVGYSETGHSGAGFYWWSTDYPEEGSAGPYLTHREAKRAALSSLDDEAKRDLRRRARE